MYNAFKTLIQRNPTLFNSITGGTLCAVSDAGAQRIEANGKQQQQQQQQHPIDFRRLLAAGILGIFFGGFVYPNAYTILDARYHQKNFSTLLTKSLVEIATVGVFCNTVSMTSRGLLAGRDRGQVMRHVVNEMPRVTVSDVGVWLPYNLVAFSVIPAVVRPTTTVLMEASWQTFISLRSHDYASRAAEEVQVAARTSPTANPTTMLCRTN